LYKIAEHLLHQPMAPIRIAGNALKDIFYSDKTPTEIGKDVEKKAFLPLAIGVSLAIVGSGGSLLAIPFALGYAKLLSPVYGGIAKVVAMGVKVIK